MRKTALLSTIAVLCTLSLMANDETAPVSRQRPRQAEHRGTESLKQMDQDNDQRISRSEWKGNEQAFDRLDANDDGFVTQDELRSAGKGLREKRSRQRLQQMDDNGDGNISRSEWKGNTDVFDRLDRDNDGVLTRDELSDGAALRRHGRRGPDSHDNGTYL